MASSVILISESSKTVFNSLDHGRRDLPQATVSRVAHQDMPTTLRSGQSIGRAIDWPGRGRRSSRGRPAGSWATSP